MPAKKKTYNIDLQDPAQVSELKAKLSEFVKRLTAVDNEIELLKADRKELVEEFSEFIDMKTFNIVMAQIKLENKIVHRDTFDEYIDAVKKENV